MKNHKWELANCKCCDICVACNLVRSLDLSGRYGYWWNRSAIGTIYKMPKCGETIKGLYIREEGHTISLIYNNDFILSFGLPLYACDKKDCIRMAAILKQHMKLKEIDLNKKEFKKLSSFLVRESTKIK